MSVLTALQHWEGGLDDLVEQANTLLPQLLPESSKPSRVREGVNPRLVRHYATQGLLDEPLKSGREARYTRRHLLQLLALRQLMSRGHSASAVQDLLRGRADDDLAALLEGTTQVDLTPPQSSNHDNPALQYLSTLPRRSLQAPKAAPALGAVAPLSQQPSPARPQEPWTRLTVEHGLELHVRDDWRPPTTSRERERLARTLTELLTQLRRK